MANPKLAPGMTFKPRRVWEYSDRKERVYGEMWTAEWWWRKQVRILDTLQRATIVR